MPSTRGFVSESGWNLHGQVGLTSFANDRLPELVLLQVNTERTVILLDKAHPLQLLDRRRHRLRADLALARVLVKVHVQPRVFLLILADRELPPDAPILERLLVPIFHPLEERGSLLAHGGVLLRVRVNFDVDLE